MTQEDAYKLVSKKKWMTARELYDKHSEKIPQSLQSFSHNLVKLSKVGYIKKRTRSVRKGVYNNNTFEYIRA